MEFNGSISFKPAMIQAIQAGRKTQTRREVKPQPTHKLIEGLAHVTVGMDPKDDGRVWYDADCINPGREVRSPHKVGDVLWVKEALYRDSKGLVRYQADELKVLVNGKKPIRNSLNRRWRWKLAKLGAMYCPRWASRYAIRITDVRCQRLQEISTLDAIAEGIDCDGGDDEHRNRSSIENYALLWASINGFDSWAENPWVWAYTFEVVK